MSVRRDRTPWIIVAILIGVIFCMLIGMITAVASWGWSQNQTKTGPTITPVFGASLISPTPLPTLVPIPPLAQGFDRWQMWLQDGSRYAGNNSVQVIGDSKYKQVVQLIRTNGRGDGGAAGLILPSNLAVASYPHLYVRLIGKIDKEMGGNIGNTNLNVYPEGAIQVRIKYLTASEQSREWYHGFFTSAILRADEEHFTQVFDGQWFTYVSLDLKSLPEPPQSIQEIRVYGFGWEFQSEVAQIDLLGSTTILQSADPTPSATRRPIQTSVVPKDKQTGEAQNGKWGKIGLSPTEQCNLPTSDAGHTVLRTNGKCSSRRIIVGCVPSDQRQGARNSMHRRISYPDLIGSPSAKTCQSFFLKTTLEFIPL